MCSSDLPFADSLFNVLCVLVDLTDFQLSSLSGQYEGVCLGVDFLLVDHAPLVAPCSCDDVCGEAEFANRMTFLKCASTRRKCQSCAAYRAGVEIRGDVRRVP